MIKRKLFFSEQAFGRKGYLYLLQWGDRPEDEVKEIVDKRSLVSRGTGERQENKKLKSRGRKFLGSRLLLSLLIGFVGLGFF